MYSGLYTLPADEQCRELSLIQQEVKEGTHDPLPMLLREVNNREKNRRRNLLSAGVSGAFLGMVIIGSTFNLTPGLLGALGGSILIATIYPAHRRYCEVKAAVEDQDLEALIDFLTDEELKDLNDFQHIFCPKTEEAQYSHNAIKLLCESAFVEEVDQKDEEARDQKEAILVPHVEVPPLELVRATDVSDPAEQGITEKNPWVEKKSKNGLRRVTLPEDNYIDRIEKDMSDAADRQLKNRFDEFERVFLQAIGAQQDQSAPTDLDDQKESVGSPTLEFDPFDPILSETKEEFLIYKALVEIEGLTPRGQPILHRMWGVLGGGSGKVAKAARDRRNEFAERLELLNAPPSAFRLYGE